MRTTGLFTTHSFEIEARSSQEVRLVIFGDVHREAQLHANEEWGAFLDRARSLKNAYFLGVGDYLDSTSASERAALGSISDRMHDTFLRDVPARQLHNVEYLADELKWMGGRLIGLMGGNHYFEFRDGTNSDQKLCGLLDTTYLGVSSFIRLNFRVTSTNCKTFDIWTHHGAGAGRLLGSSINRVQQMAEWAEADAYIMGDDHAKIAVQGQARFQLVSSKHGLTMKTRRPWLVRSGSFLKAYVPGESSYNVDACRGPRNLGHVELSITPRAHRDSVELEVHGWS